MALTKITTSVVAVNSLTTANIADNSIDATKIASNSILTRHIDDAQITTDQILDGTIATADIADDAVTEDKLANAINTSIAAKLPLAGGTMTGTLTVAGSGSGTVDAIIITNTDTTNNGLSIGVDSSENAFFWNGSNTSMNFATNNTERMRIDSSGNLLVGATSFNTGAFGATKGINVAHTQPIVLLHETDTDKDGYIGMAASEMFIGTADAIPIRFHTSDAEKMRIDASGNLIMTAGGTIRAGGANDLILDAGESGTPDIYLLSGGSTKVKIEGSNGNVGIGTTSPASKLHIFDGGSSVNNTITFGNPSATPKAEIKHTASGNEFLNISCKGTTSGFGNIAFYTGSTPDERVRINHQGNISFGAQKQDPSISQFFNGITGNYGSGLSMQNNGYAVLGLCNNFFINNSTQNQRVLAQPTQQLQLDHLGNFLFQTAASGTAGGTFSFSEKMRLDVNGNLLVDTANNSSSHKVCINGSLGVITSGNGNRNFQVFTVSNENWNVADTLMRCGKNGTTGRSINAGGTINASGADYAEYMKKADSCGTIAKGDVCGVDSTGKLTDVFADAISFVIKSTNPSYVGGDTWGDVDLELTEEQTETERQKHDRIAFSGQVPVNITGSFNVGDYVYPQANGTDIECVAKSSPTFEEYQICLGKIWATQSDGRPLVAVKIS